MNVKSNSASPIMSASRGFTHSKSCTLRDGTALEAFATTSIGSGMKVGGCCISFRDRQTTAVFLPGTEFTFLGYLDPGADITSVEYRVPLDEQKGIPVTVEVPGGQAAIIVDGRISAVVIQSYDERYENAFTRDDHGNWYITNRDLQSGTTTEKVLLDGSQTAFLC